MSKFSEFIKQDQSRIREEKEIKKEDVSELIDKYSTYSEDELMREFLTESKRKKDRGELSDDQVLKMKELLSPYLDGHQKEKLEELIKMVK